MTLKVGRGRGPKWKIKFTSLIVKAAIAPAAELVQSTNVLFIFFLLDVLMHRFKARIIFFLLGRTYASFQGTEEEERRRRRRAAHDNFNLLNGM